MSTIEVTGVALQSLGSQYKITGSYTVHFDAAETKQELPTTILGEIRLRTPPLASVDVHIAYIPKSIVFAAGMNKRACTFEVICPAIEVALKLRNGLEWPVASATMAGMPELADVMTDLHDAIELGWSGQFVPIFPILQKYGLSPVVRAHLRPNLPSRNHSGYFHATIDAI